MAADTRNSRQGPPHHAKSYRPVDLPSLSWVGAICHARGKKARYSSKYWETPGEMLVNEDWCLRSQLCAHHDLYNSYHHPYAIDGVSLTFRTRNCT